MILLPYREELSTTTPCCEPCKVKLATRKQTKYNNNKCTVCLLLSARLVLVTIIDMRILVSSFNRWLSRRWCHSCTVNGFGLNSPPCAAVTFPDIFMTTLCPLWVLQLSRICQTCTLCKSFPSVSWKCCFLLIQTNSCFDSDCTIGHCVCFRMLRGASMMQDFPILTWTNKLESLWVNVHVASVPYCPLGVSQVTD